MSAPEPDWKAIAQQLAKRVMFAINHLDAYGSGLVGSPDTPSDEWQHWRDYFADGLDLVPGMKLDREIMRCLNLPRSKRAKAIAAIQKARGEAST